MDIPPIQTLSLLPAGKLDPARLAPAAEKAIAELLIEGESANTRSSYRSATLLGRLVCVPIWPADSAAGACAGRDAVNRRPHRAIDRRRSAPRAPVEC